MRISKELLCEVLNVKEVKKVKIGYLQEFINYIDKEDKVRAINIYKFAYMCKIWTFDKGYLLQARVGRDLSVIDVFDNNTHKLLAFIVENTENEAVFRASEFVLKQRGVKIEK